MNTVYFNTSPSEPLPAPTVPPVEGFTYRYKRSVARTLVCQPTLLAVPLCGMVYGRAKNIPPLPENTENSSQRVADLETYLEKRTLKPAILHIPHILHEALRHGFPC